MTERDGNGGRPKAYRRGEGYDPAWRFQIPAASYREPDLAEDVGNPFALALPAAIEDSAELSKRMAVPVVFSDADRRRPAFQRMRLLLRLRRSILPLAPLEPIYRSLSLMMSEAYVGRNPLIPRRLRERPRPNTLTAAATGLGMVVLGRSGVGKTTAIEAALALFPYAIEHTSFKGAPFVRYQVPYVKTSCGSNSKEFCNNLMSSIDATIGTTYAHDLKPSSARHVLQHDVYRIVDESGVGVIVVDDLQNLVHARSDDQELVLETLEHFINVEKVPLVVIGTEDALPLLIRKRDHSRRFTGMPTIVVREMVPDEDWTAFCGLLWGMRLVLPGDLPMPADFAAELYTLSRGLVDLAVKLVHFAQYRAIDFAMADPAAYPERLDGGSLRETYMVAVTLLHAHAVTGDADPFELYDEKVQRFLDPARNPDLLAALSTLPRPEAASAPEPPPPEAVLPRAIAPEPDGAPPAPPGRKGSRKGGGPVVALVEAGAEAGLDAHAALAEAGMIWAIGEEAAGS